MCKKRENDAQDQNEFLDQFVMGSSSSSVIEVISDITLVMVVLSGRRPVQGIHTYIRTYPALRMYSGRYLYYWCYYCTAPTCHKISNIIHQNMIDYQGV